MCNMVKERGLSVNERKKVYLFVSAYVGMTGGNREKRTEERKREGQKKERKKCSFL